MFTATTYDGRVVRMFVADVMAFVDHLRAQDDASRGQGELREDREGIVSCR